MFSFFWKLLGSTTSFSNEFISVISWRGKALLHFHSSVSLNGHFVLILWYRKNRSSQVYFSCSSNYSPLQKSLLYKTATSVFLTSLREFLHALIIQVTISQNLTFKVRHASSTEHSDNVVHTVLKSHSYDYKANFKPWRGNITLNIPLATALLTLNFIFCCAVWSSSLFRSDSSLQESALMPLFWITLSSAEVVASLFTFPFSFHMINRCTRTEGGSLKHFSLNLLPRQWIV